MVVHADDARHDRVASQVEDGGAVARGWSAPGEIAAILPFSIVMFRSAIGAAPVPSMTSTCSRMTFGALTRTYLRISGPSASAPQANAAKPGNTANEKTAIRRRILRMIRAAVREVGVLRLARAGIEGPGRHAGQKG